jgi:ABC-type branched-subunit amino acid transport system permease subunit
MHDRGRVLLPILVIAVSFVFFYLFIKSPPIIAIPTLAATIVAILILDRTGVMESLQASVARRKAIMLPLLAFMALIVPFSMPDAYVMHLCVLICIYSIINIGLDFQLGMTNMMNFATAAFCGVGAYTSALLTVRLHLPVLLAIPLGALNAGLFGLLIGIPTLRTRNYYLSLVTIAFQFIFVMFIDNMEWTGGPDGVRGISLLAFGKYSLNNPLHLFGRTLPYQASFYYLSIGLLAIAIWITTRLRNSRIGLTWNAIRADEIAATCQGINPANAKLTAFAAGAVFAGLAGAIYTHYVGFISPNNFSFNFSVELACMLIFGGLDNVTGIIVGTIILTVLPEKLREFSEYRMVIYGVVVLAMLAFRPQGLFPKRLRDYTLLSRR